MKIQNQRNKKGQPIEKGDTQDVKSQKKEKGRTNMVS